MSSATANPSTVGKGLEGVSAGETSICAVDQTSLIYRGYEIADLAAHATFEEVAYLLLVGHKPNANELRFFKDELVANRAVSPQVIAYLREVAPMLRNGPAVPMDVLRTCVSIMGNYDADAQDNSPEAELRKAKRLLAQIPTAIGHMQRLVDKKELVSPDIGGDAHLSHAGNLLYLMTGEKPSDEFARVIDVSLILYAEHDFNASTFTSRIIASTLGDMHSAVTGAIGALKGPLHGGANEAAMDMLKEMMHDMKGDITPANVQAWMDKAFAEKRKLMGFGHRVYKNGDHRAPILHGLGRNIAAKDTKNPDGYSATKWFELGEMVQKIMLEQKNIHPNVDFPCGLTYFTMGIPVPQYTPIFVASRVSGWAAHIMEQHQNNRLIRPRADYTGEPLRKW
ncbi:MAG: citrate synthase [Phycisphaeraceae bacterium]|nr:citrate synthase [Phycisphaerales bacterium]MCB9861283.1 citrate synthase [Phycisphaeraceae bacterium]